MPCLPRVAFSLGSTTQAYLLLQLVWFSGLVRECGASGTQQFDFWASSKRLKSIQSGNCMSWKQVHRPWHSWWLCCQESVRTSDLLFTWERCPSVSLSQTLRLWPSVPWECWGGDRTDVAFEKSVPRGDPFLLYLPLAGKVHSWQPPKTAPWLYFTKGTCCSQRLSLWTFPLTSSQGHEINLLLRQVLWKNGHIVPGTPSGLRTAEEAWLAICE